MKYKWGIWITGIIGGAINSASAAVAAYIVGLGTNPDTGMIAWTRLGALAGIMAILGAALYLKEHSTPEPWDGIERRVVAPLLILALLCGVASFTGGCAPKMLVLTPEGARAYTATQIGVRIGELGDAAIAANKSGGLPDAVAIPIVLFSYHTLKVLEATPAGWQQMVASAWAALKATLPGPVNPILVATWSAVDLILAAYKSVPGDVPKTDPATLERFELWLAAQGAL